MKAVHKAYRPAAGRDWALPLYDPLMKLLGAEKARKALVDQAAVQLTYRVLDIGCGTGTLAVVIKRLYPEVDLVGVDPDAKALGRARRKARRAAVTIRFDEGFSDELPYSDASFDRVFSCFMLHHLRADEKGKALGEMRRVVAPGGSLHLLDFERPEARADGLSARWIEHLNDNSEQRILALIEQAGLVSKKVMSAGMLFGLLRLGFYEGFAPTPAVQPAC